jgi:hypothetical protein
MSRVHECPDARALLFSSRPGMHGPKEQSLRFAATVDADGRWRVNPGDFGDGGVVRLEDVQTDYGALPLSVTLDSSAQGDWQPDGEMWIEVPFVFTIRVPILGSLSSYATLRLDTGAHRLQATGAQASGGLYDAASGRLLLAGAGAFVDGPLHGVQLLVGLSGHLHPAALG